MQPEKHKCGQCNLEFTSEQTYLDHVCEKTGFSPADIMHQETLNPGYDQMSKTNLARGNLRKELEKKGMSPEEAQKEVHKKFGGSPITK